MSESPITVLLIEDEESHYRLITEQISAIGCDSIDIVWAAELQEGIDRLTQESFSGVLLDLSLPGSRGMETFEAVHDAASDVPIIILTSLQDDELGGEIVARGAQDYLIKGKTDGYWIVRAIRHAIERKRIEEQLESYSRELRERNMQLETDLAMAREIQQWFMPETMPHFPAGASDEETRIRFGYRYLPSAKVGGDFFDIRRLSDTCAGVFVCDVVGHGMRAALITAMVRGLLEELANTYTTPGECMTSINHSLCDILRQPDELIFVTAIYAIIDAEAGTLCYANAGHPQPLFRTPIDKAGVSDGIGDGPRGPALVVRRSHAYESSQMIDICGDGVLLYTDGITEVTGSDGREFGAGGMLTVLRAEPAVSLDAVADGVLQGAREFSGIEVFDDDVCLVWVEIPGERD
ncbi:MAG: SpoIIE family protein phosphatase [Verrucomicrobia bacterium]|nr:SpoIIE family protein phosphatase [Verrucomicrobiota bacterium]MDA1087043.1 SpoIIE family protein phosphatase [Verrucomicrobiota bacterium]